MKRNLISTAILSVFVAACGSSVPSGTSSSTSGRAAGTTTSSSSSTQPRQCLEHELQIPGPSNLADFFQTAVRNLEGPVTYCLDVSGSGTSISGSLRVEYEDDFGIRSFEMSSSQVFGGEIKNTSGDISIEIVFMDNYGLVQVKGSAPASTGVFDGKIRYYNFPTYEEALNDSIKEAQDKCRSGVWTVAQCQGFNFPPTYWWNAPLYTSERQRMIDQAKAILNDSSKARDLGTLQVDVGDIYQ